MPSIVEEFTPLASSESGAPSTSEGAGAPVEVVANVRGRALSDTTKAMLAKLEADDDAADDDDGGGGEGGAIDPDDIGLDPSTPAPAAAPAAGTEAKPAEAAPAPNPADEYKAVNERLTARNRDLVARLEALEKPQPKREMSEREKALDESERLYLEKPREALRLYLATAIAVADPSSPEVDAELRGLYQDLTEEELGVAPSESAKAKRESERTRRMWEREKRERAAEKAAEATAAPQAQNSAEAQNAIGFIGHHLSTKGADGAAPADKFPLLSEVAQDLDGEPPEVLIFREIGRAIAAGEADEKTPGDQLIAAAAARLESKYQALAAKLAGKAKSSTSTAPPVVQPTSVTASPTEGANHSHGVRSITQASASVAPATPPASKPEAPKEPPKYRNENERRKAILSKHLSGN